ncbi:Hypothetical Protein FCC1311_086832 [Hondaea fermentalgiana]|uniref:Uncharacterized protein n=1 Tax=Hondaea fermentalgiana TaxID=2315210 RepID=A0A2R5GRS3_9STRA|nr:Hypothetical Protein FCC1311_086832 [Hondaea fermentalgiana]|eukprot:GBG32458.1 Hypothetical Protein FCC1311_086832 [Hondaea fermentalgiana]
MQALMSVVALDVTLYSLALPYFPAVLHEGVSEKTWLHGQAASNGLAAVAGFVIGALSDWLGRKRLLVASQVVCVACWALFVAGILTGRADLLLLAFVVRKSNRTFPLACSLVTDITPSHEERQRRLSRLGSMFGLGFALGPAAAGLSSRWFEVSSLFQLGLGLAAFNLAVVCYSIPSSPAPVRIWTTEAEINPKPESKPDGEDANATFDTDNARTNADDAGISADGARVHAATAASLVQSLDEMGPPQRISVWVQVQRAIREPNLGLVLAVHALACMGQFSYITTMAVAAKERFSMDSASYGSLLTFLGISYSFCLAVIIPRLAHVCRDLRHLLIGALGLTALARFYIARLFGPDDVPRLFLGHAVVAVGTSGITFVIADLITSWGRRLNLTGIVVGTQDSVQRVMGVLAPLLVAHLSTGQTSSLSSKSTSSLPSSASTAAQGDDNSLADWTYLTYFLDSSPDAPPLFLGSQVSAILYLCALHVALLLYIVPSRDLAQEEDYYEVESHSDHKME